jgi:DNA-binding NarL/FixJ family response regulator
VDLSLPELEVEELISVLREKYTNISVIVLSGRPEIRSEALASGADAFVSKADLPDRLFQAISSVNQS